MAYEIITFLIIVLQIIRCFCAENARCHHLEYNFNLFAKGLKPNSDCLESEICKRNYTVSMIDYPPFNNIIVLDGRIHGCCGRCTKLKINKELTNITELDFKISNNVPDFIFPVLGSTYKETTYGYYFMPVCPVPDYVYISPKLAPAFTRLLNGSLSVLPLIIICLLMTVVSGFITWILETRINNEEFPNDIFHGWFEGMWWSFISMTTVGYGDKTPRSILGRIYAIIWILMGITLFGILTGLLTNAIMDVNYPKKQELKDKKVGVLKYRTHDAIVTANHDGKIMQSKGGSFNDDLVQLVIMLYKRDIDGIIFDKLTYWSILFEVYSHNEKTNYSEIPEIYRETFIKSFRYFYYQTMTTDIKYNGEKQSYGILVKDKDVYEYFRDAVVDNANIIQLSIKNLIDSYSITAKNIPEEIFKFESQTYEYAVAALGGVMLLFCFFGIIYSLIRRRRSRDLSMVGKR